VLERAQDRAVRERLGRAGRARAERLFAYDRTNERMAQLFTAAIPS
jgi:hypothetical protein